MEAAFNQWNVYPINLSTEEIADPLIVISDFFSDDSLSGHLERLMLWRDFVLRDDYYRDSKGNPAGLLYFYKLNLRLVEAVNLLLRAFPADLSDEYIHANTPVELDAVLSRLSEAQRLDLYSVLSAFFASYSLQQYRKQLFEWLEHGLSKKGAEEFITSIDLITVYENLQGFYSAEWLMGQHLPGCKFLTPPKPITNISTLAFSDATVYRLDTNISGDLVVSIGKIVSVIKYKLTTVQVVYYLGAIGSTSDKLYFLVFTADDEIRHAHSLASMIEESCIAIIPVHAIVLQVSKLFDGVAHGNRFFTQALSAPLLYLSGDEVQPSLTKQKDGLVSNKTAFNWERWHIQGMDFLSVAEFYVRRRSFGAALFSLHQCAECLLTAINKTVLDYNIGSHNLTRLLEMTQMFTPDIAELFDLGNEEKSKQFDMLKHAYINVRYKNNYEPDGAYIQELHATIQWLAIVVEKVYQKHLLINNL